MPVDNEALAWVGIVLAVILIAAATYAALSRFG